MKFGDFRRNFGQNAARLRHLDLAFNGVGTRGAEALAAALVQPTCVLESLNLKCNQIGEDGAEALAEALRTNRMLRSLELAVNSIGNPGGWELADSYSAGLLGGTIPRIVAQLLVHVRYGRAELMPVELLHTKQVIR